VNSTLHIHYGNYQHIAPYWDGTTYFATCWRLYHNETSGGRLSTRYGTVDLMPDHLYLMPPGFSFTAAQKNNPKQFFLHFDVGEPYDRVQPRVYPIPLDTLLGKLLRRCIEAVQPPPAFLTDAGTMHAMALVAAALAGIPPEHFAVMPLDPRVEEAIGYFREQVNIPHGIADVARRVGMSRGAFIRLFRQETGSTPYAYLTEMRIAWACDLLVRNETLPIDLVAEYAGFHDRFHFSRVFKQWIGIPPAAYRKRERQPSA